MPIQPLAGATALAKLDKVQNNALRLMSGGLKSTPIVPMEVLQGVEPLNLRRKKASLATGRVLICEEANGDGRSPHYPGENLLPRAGQTSCIQLLPTY